MVKHSKNSIVKTLCIHQATIAALVVNNSILCHLLYCNLAVTSVHLLT